LPFKRALNIRFKETLIEKRFEDADWQPNTVLVRQQLTLRTAEINAIARSYTSRLAAFSRAPPGFGVNPTMPVSALVVLMFRCLLRFSTYRGRAQF
jgi:hypothetical protein